MLRCNQQQEGLSVCNTSTLQHRPFPFHLELFGRLFGVQRTITDYDLPGSFCLKALFLLDGLKKTEEIVQFGSTL